MTRLGHAVDSAPDGEESDTIVRIHSYDVIILDLIALLLLVGGLAVYFTKPSLGADRLMEWRDGTTMDG